MAQVCQLVCLMSRIYAARSMIFYVFCKPCLHAACNGTRTPHFVARRNFRPCHVWILAQPVKFHRASTPACINKYNTRHLHPSDPQRAEIGACPPNQCDTHWVWHLPPHSNQCPPNQCDTHWVWHLPPHSNQCGICLP